jgi:hypothetical protein
VAVRKKRPVLYEVYRPPSKSADPTWKPRPSSSSPPTDRPAARRDGESEAPSRAPVSHGPTTPAATGRWQVTISAPTLAILGAAMVVLLAVVFSAGRHYESVHPSATTGAILTQTDGADPSTGAQDGSGAGTDAPGASQAGELVSAPDETSGAVSATVLDATGDKPLQVALRPGYHYVIIQHFKKRSERQAALKAAEYLQANGVACATMTGADIRLIATEAFLIKQRNSAAARRERERAGELTQRIKELGQQYNKDLLKRGESGYTFSDCYLFEIK